MPSTTAVVIDSLLKTALRNAVDKRSDMPTFRRLTHSVDKNSVLISMGR